jgi:hypothetical protein
MATITIRLSDGEKAETEARAAREGVNVSELVRRALGMQRDAPDLGERLDTVEQRLGRLEDIAGL